MNKITLKSESAKYNALVDILDICLDIVRDDEHHDLMPIVDLVSGMIEEMDKIYFPEED